MERVGGISPAETKYVKQLYDLSTKASLSKPDDKLHTHCEVAERFLEAAVDKDVEYGTDGKGAAAVLLAMLLPIDVKPTDLAWRQ
ncbi:hypothetical protein DOTSEDRAFT_25887 [Dothistroma septosporum NZE10]|uniref:Uncharacterized protein n=1 Tax=Dothistroma septosporum (strain NZE10 / CBS 128990) TaxID=675120 RepID=N1PI27_DOTSN|nr:hypothetical protein DOTSEDRAFT_25887 [Dothistroma septosporum NZE10]